MVKRREFISSLSIDSGWPLAARAQQPAMPVIGLLDSRLPDWRFSAAARQSAPRDRRYRRPKTCTAPEFPWMSRYTAKSVTEPPDRDTSF
jgi:hypothetical protein